MVEVLSGHRLYATAPSWDGQWLSKLLRAAALPRHALRLEDTTVAHGRLVRRVLMDTGLPEEAARPLAAALLTAIAAEPMDDKPPAHRALADARAERALWQAIRIRAEALAASQGSEPG